MTISISGSLVSILPALVPSGDTAARAEVTEVDEETLAEPIADGAVIVDVT